MPKFLYKRVLLKLSGEAFVAQQGQQGIDTNTLAQLASKVVAMHQTGVQVAIVVGGGNLFRGDALSKTGMNRITADQISILATVMNALAFRESLEEAGALTCVQSAVDISGFVEPFNRRQAIEHLNNGRIVVFAGGTGNPLVTTDSTASLRAIEIDADVLLKATKVDGIYDGDPKTNPKAKRFSTLTYNDVIQRDLCVMDLAAVCMCRDNKMSLRVFNMYEENVFTHVLTDDSIGTMVGD